MREGVKQIRIVHLSDLHFGGGHRFAPPKTPSGDRTAARGRPTLLEMIKKDWASREWDSDEWKSDDESYPLVVALTGDLTQTISSDEVKQAEDFVHGLSEAPILGSSLKPEDILVVPGNHDVTFTEADVGRRLMPYCSFYQELFRVPVSPKAPEQLSRVRSIDKWGLVAVEINSCAYVLRGTEDEQRGQVDDASLSAIRDGLKAIPPGTLRKCVRIALVHHHPVVLPALAEAGRGYDAVINSDKLLAILQDYGFHAILHGHKHYPYTFSYDAVCAWTDEVVHPIMIVSGGSVGSTELPNSPRACNTYNMILLKWHPDSERARIRVVTRALVTHDSKGRQSLPSDWYWKTLRVDDRHLFARHGLPDPSDANPQPFTHGQSPASEGDRVRMYQHLRGNVPVVEVIPSLHPDQVYEARVWIVGHNRTSQNIPRMVIWSGGPKFPNMAVCYRDVNSYFCTSFEYYGPILIQARMQFEDDSWAAGYVYARLPEAYDETSG